jgi:hypothetical protein
MTNDMKKALEFARKYNQWHSFANDYKTKKAINNLVKLNLVKVNEFNQFIGV